MNNKNIINSYVMHYGNEVQNEGQNASFSTRLGSGSERSRETPKQV